MWSETSTPLLFKATELYLTCVGRHTLHDGVIWPVLPL